MRNRPAVNRLLTPLRSTRAAQFIQKMGDDHAPDLAVLLAWGLLSALLPLFLGILAIAGLLLRDASRLDQLSKVLFTLLPPQSATTLRDVLEQTEQRAGAAGLISILLLLFNGSNVFASMERVFNLAYGIPSRNIIVQRLIGLLTLLAVSLLLLISTFAYSIGEVLSSVSNALLLSSPIPMPARSLSSVLVASFTSLVTALAMFWLLYTLLPNRMRRWRQTLPGAMVAAALFFLILHLFPLYLSLFGQGFEPYAAFGVFLILMFWLYLLGWVIVLGVEVNAFLEGSK
jgi:membrane protein